MGSVFRVLLPAQVRHGDRVSFFVRNTTSEDLGYFQSEGVEFRTIASATSLARQLREFDVVHLHSADLDLLAAGWLSCRPTVFTLHGLRAQTRGASTFGARRLPTLRGLRRRLKRLGLSLLLRHAMTRVVTVSEFLTVRAVESYGVNPRRLSVVYNGIALDQFRGRSRPPGHGFVVGWAGRLVPVKRVDVLLRAMASIVSADSIPGLRVIIVGDGALRADLEAQTVSLGISSIVDFAGHSDHPELLLAQMDLFVFPSRGEGGAMAVNEALAMGLPVVVLQDGGGVVELIERSGGGVVVRDEAALAGEITSLLRDPERRRRLSESGIAYASRELDPLAWAARYDAVYQAALHERHARAK
jgi:glycosyltransferase involved in cell wall biosynthesis